MRVKDGSESCVGTMGISDVNPRKGSHDGSNGCESIIQGALISVSAHYKDVQNYVQAHVRVRGTRNRYEQIVRFSCNVPNIDARSNNGAEMRRVDPARP